MLGGNGDPMQRVNYQISWYPPHENKNNEEQEKYVGGSVEK